MDLYALLGVARNASTDAIERAYRRLARRYHPGVNPGDRAAEEMFRQVREAYEVLGHLERRRAYDQSGPGPAALLETETTVAFEGFDFSAPANGPMAATFSELFSDVFQEAARQATAPTRGLGIDITLQLSFKDAIQGGRFPLSVIRQERCGTCVGTGRTPRPAITCPVCGGQGGRRWARGHMVFTKACEACEGTGRLTTQPCTTCAGAGLHPRSEVVTVAVPPGIESGARVAVPGRGHAGGHPGTAGDLYVTIEVAEHPTFRRVGRDLHLTVPVAVHEAALGARIEIPTLDEPVRLRILPGTAAGQRLRIKGKGVPSATDPDAAGDLVAEVQIVLPPVRDERSRELLREFGRLNDADVRAHLFAGD